MRNKNHIVVKVIVILFSAVTFLACQEEIEPETVIAEEGITESSPLTEKLLMLTKLDGSSDNIIDKTSCLKIQFPIEGIYEDQQLQFNSITEVYEYRTAALDIEWIYPIIALSVQHETIILESEDSLEFYQDNCREGGIDDDIECLDLIYPLEVDVYNVNTESVNTIAIQNDEQAFGIFGNEDFILSISYPITLQDQQNNLFKVYTNDELQSTIENADECDEADDTDFETFFQDQRITLLKSANWVIKRFTNNSEDISDYFSSFIFQFKDENQLTVAADTDYLGEWRVEIANTTEILAFDIEVSEDSLSLLNQEWLIIRANDKKIVLRNDDIELNQQLTLEINQ